jgi:hypothetical protein
MGMYHLKLLSETAKVLAVCAPMILIAESAHAGCFNAAQTRDLISAGKVVPLNAVSKSISGTIKAAKLCTKGNGYIYNVTVLTPSGQVKKQKIRASK